MSKRSTSRCASSLLALLVAAAFHSGRIAVAAQTPTATSTPTGDAKRGKTLFEQTYRCYACHGFLGEAGSPRLVPMARTQEQFLTYVRKPSTQGMPAFSDVPARDLEDVYAYVRSLRPESPPVDSIPLLKDLLQQIAKAK